MKSTQYSEATLDHFRNPRNVGTLDGDDVALGRVGNPTCGDLMDIYIRVKDDTIDDIRFQTFGCGSAVATSSMVTELVKGMPLDEALEVTRADVADALGGLPPIKMHCSNLAADALHEAIENWRSGITPEEIESHGIGAPACMAIEESATASIEHYMGKGVFKSVGDLESLRDQRVLVVDTGEVSAELAISLTEVSGRVVFVTRGKTLPYSTDVVERVARSDVKVLYECELVDVGGEGVVERVRIHDLDEDDEYDLFVDAVIVAE